ncbi:MAG: tetratricopeptide repeat protein [Leptolyngbyaceae cyanobacterium SU_3_3]|nr:tetratricopeptide repeat protein [Leptolyngbyaceae cyanobacterium SU_3_3]
MAVCDDVDLRDRFAAQLRLDSASQPGAGLEETNGRSDRGVASPCRLVTLSLNLPNPDVLAQVTQGSQRGAKPDSDWVPTFQMVGVEALTREPVHIQRAFLDSLQRFAKQRSAAEFNLVLWVSRPWCRSIQQSVPEFWRWHTGLFEFEGDPAPMGERKGRGRDEDLHKIKVQSSKSSTPPSPIPAAPLAPTPTPRLKSPPDRSRSESELADLVLASVMQAAEAGGTQTLDNLDLNHPDFEPMRLWQHLEELQLNQAPAAAHAAAYRQLGDWYRDRVEQGEASQQNLTITIRAYEQVLRFLEANSSQIPDVLNDVGNLYWMLSRCATAASHALVHLEKALKAYQIALGKTNPQTRPTTYAMIQNNLGSAYSDLAQRQNPAENLQQAIVAYQLSLQYRQVEVDAARYAATKIIWAQPTGIWHSIKTPLRICSKRSPSIVPPCASTILSGNRCPTRCCKQPGHSVLESGPM